MKAVLLSAIPLPYHKIGSWDKRYTELILSEQNPFEYVICPEVDKNKAKSNFATYLFANRYKYEKLLKLYYKYSYYFYLKKISSLLTQEKNLVIYIIDNVKLLNETHEFLVKKKIRNNCKIVFNSCGYSYFFSNADGINFYDKIDHLIFSTYEAYQFELKRQSYISSKVSIIPNGIDSSKFCKISDDEKNSGKEKIGYKNKKVILWVSQERPKKGLHILLEAWEKSGLNNDEEFVLVVIGTSQNKQEGNIHYLGKIPNNDLVIYYQCADYFFFTTLVHEGFGLSLGEAIKCGATSFVSNIAPMKEVTQNGKLAYLVDNPNIVDSWVHVLNQIKTNKITAIPTITKELNELYDLNDWLNKITSLVHHIKSFK